MFDNSVFKFDNIGKANVTNVLCDSSTMLNQMKIYIFIKQIADSESSL